uniref:Uncharacterized protein n=1 Tax=Arion vulgaris TaxID=1028688 RepID=A0A0B7BNS0_9EUPU
MTSDPGCLTKTSLDVANIRESWQHENGGDKTKLIEIVHIIYKHESTRSRTVQSSKLFSSAAMSTQISTLPFPSTASYASVNFLRQYMILSSSEF